MRTRDRVAGLFGVDGRIALVTGASSGIGRHVAGVLAAAGARVVLLARRAETLEAAADEIRAGGGAAAAIAADIGAIEAVAGAYDRAVKPFGPPDILVNAAGLNPRLPADALTPEVWRQTIDINLSVPFFLAQRAVPAMRARGFGNIVNLASLQTGRAFRNGIAYGAAKGGLGQLTRAMAEAWSGEGSGIVANAIAPGFFPTELTAPVFADAALAEHHARATCIGRNGRLEDLDGAILFLASRASAYITGQILAVDGGYTAK
jgi:NAD(P)-dependent dehydrogenase (short-subunit alcohol dehydrogenase family)